MGIEDDYNREWGTRWNVGTPRNRWPRKVRHWSRIEAALVASQPMLGYGAWNDFKTWNAGRNLTASSGPAPSASNISLGNIGWRRILRAGGGAKELWYRHWGPTAMHHILDPTGGYAGWSIIAQDLVRCIYQTGNGWPFFGFWSFNGTDETAKTGCGWHSDPTNKKWISGVYDGTGTPSTTLHETSHSTLASEGENHRLATVLDAASKSVLFYADGALVDSYTPTAPLGEMSDPPRFGYYGVTETGAELRIHTFGGGNPRLLTFLSAD